ncbi:P-type E1-E2 ATPase [Desulfitispora alkaliphila]|uniref:HAD family hydrolase n=1 Tax=Desulfitispora alkaliphila TaxID=622674 RepID=UPI003D1F4072
MIEVEVPGRKKFQIKHLVLDYNGTLACDGRILPEAIARINQLAQKLDVYVLTADTFGNSTEACKQIKAQLVILKQELGSGEKLDFVKSLGAENTVAIGNGSNDAQMLQQAVLGIAVVGKEGAAVETLMKADIATNNIGDALDLLCEPKRLKATLRK